MTFRANGRCQLGSSAQGERPDNFIDGPWDSDRIAPPQRPKNRVLTFQVSTQVFGRNLPQAVQVSAIQVDSPPFSGAPIRFLYSMYHVVAVLKGANCLHTERETNMEFRASGSSRRRMAGTGYCGGTDQAACFTWVVMDFFPRVSWSGALFLFTRHNHSSQSTKD